MNRTLKTIALCGVIGLTAVSCQKENLVENPGEINKALIQKVEELTLHVIELQKQIDELKSQK